MIILHTKKNGNLSVISIMLLGLYFGILVLIFPLTYEIESPMQRVVFSILYSFQCIYVGQDFDYIQGQIILLNFSLLYRIALYFSFIFAPILTTSFIISLIETFVHGIHCRLAMLNPFKKEIHIFSNINEESVTLAENIPSKNRVFIFCNEKDDTVKENLKERLRNIKAVTISNSEKSIKVGHSKNIFFYEISNNEIQNMDNALHLIDYYQDYENIKISIFSTRREAELLLDSVNRKVKVSLINKNKYALYHLFLNKPIIKYARDNVISVLLMGEENRVLEMIKMTLWSMQLENYKLIVNVVGDNATHIEERLYHDCPGLENYKYTICFYDADVQSQELDRVLEEHCLDTDYIILGFQEDGLSIETALFLRRYFLYMDHESYSNTPQINLWLESEIGGIDQIGINEKNYLIGKDKNIKMYFQIDSFGTNEKIFQNMSELTRSLEDHALLCHLANVGALNNSPEEGMEKDTANFYHREKTREFAIALAIHMKNLLYTFDINLFDESITDELIGKVQSLVDDPEVLQSLMNSDTRMWNCYNRCAGFQKISFEEVVKYYSKVTTILQHSMAKLNPCLTDFDEFEKHEDDTERLFHHRYSFIKAERKYIQYFPKILRLLKEKGY